MSWRLCTVSRACFNFFWRSASYRYALFKSKLVPSKTPIFPAVLATRRWSDTMAGSGQLSNTTSYYVLAATILIFERNFLLGLLLLRSSLSSVTSYRYLLSFQLGLGAEDPNIKKSVGGVHSKKIILKHFASLPSTSGTFWRLSHG